MVTLTGHPDIGAAQTVNVGTTANDGNDYLANSANAVYVAFVDDSNAHTLTNADPTYYWEQNISFQFLDDGATPPDGRVTVTVPSGEPDRGMLNIFNRMSQDMQVEISGQPAAAPIIPAGAAAVLARGATNIRLVSLSPISATLQTTDATVTSIAEVGLAPGESKTVRGFGIAQGPSNASVGFDFTVSAHNNGGTTVSDGSTLNHNDANANGWTITYDIDDTNDVMRIRANGAGATTIDWRVQYEVAIIT